MARPWQIEDVCRLLTVFRGFSESPDHDALWWRTDGEYAPVTFLLNTNDLFYWAVADAEIITPDDMPDLEKALAEMQAVGGGRYAGELWASRKIGMRPQRPCYKYFPESTHHLFDACGPARDE